MDLLTHSLISEITGDKLVTAVYGGGFKPPTKGHLEVVQKALSDFPEIDKFIIYVGQGERNGITQSESILIWEIYKKYLPSKVEIQPSKAPIGDIFRYAKNNPEEIVYFIIGAREGNEGDLQDISQRTTGVEDKYSNLKVKVIQTADSGISGTKAREASKNSPEAFYQFLPPNLTDSEKLEIFGYIQDVVTELNLPKVSDIKEKFKVFVSKLKQEGKETKAAFSLLVKAAKGEIELTDLDKRQIKEQLKDIIKGVFGAAVFALPAGGLVLLLLKLIKLHGLITPSAFLEENDPEDGKAAPYGSGYNELNENASYSKDIDIKGRIMQLTQHMLDKGYNIKPLPTVEFVNGDSENAREFLGKTAYYNPESQTIVLYTEGRHPKDIVRSFSHEMIHHIQNLEGRLGVINTTNTQEDNNLNDIEAEANLKGTMTFRNWTDSLNEAIIGDLIECDGCGWSWKIVDGGDDLFMCHKCGHDNTPLNEDGKKTSEKNMDDYKKNNNPKGVKDPFGINAYARELAQGLEEKILNEGKYDKLTNQLSSIAFEAFKDIHDRGDKEGGFEFRVDNPEDEHDIPSEEFYFDFVGKVEITDDEYEVDGGANAGFDKDGNEITPLLSVKFRIPKNPDWQRVSFDIKDVVRHELEHLTQDGDNVKPGKQMDDDQMLRDLIDLDLLPKADYFRLPKEIDAMLQGLYLKAKKSKRPYREVIDDYLATQPIDSDEKENILKIWRNRAKALSLPVFEYKSKVMENANNQKYTIYCDMDGVLVDFDKQFEKASGGISPREYEETNGKEAFWNLIDNENGVGFWVGMPWMPNGKQLWDYIKPNTPILLSSPSRSNSSRLGKRLWVRNNLPGTKLILANSYNKKNYADSNNILIDDRPSNIDQWKAAGGIGILFISTEQTIKELKELGL
jgi:hypothetical protein